MIKVFNYMFAFVMFNCAFVIMLATLMGLMPPMMRPIDFIDAFAPLLCVLFVLTQFFAWQMVRAFHTA